MQFSAVTMRPTTSAFAVRPMAARPMRARAPVVVRAEVQSRGVFELAWGPGEVWLLAGIA